MMFLLTFFNIRFTLFGVLDVKLTGLFWLLDTTVKKVKNTINFEVMIIVYFDNLSLLKMELLLSKLKFK